MSAFVIIASLILRAELAERPAIIVVVGAPGAPEYGTAFDTWAGRWEKAAKGAGVPFARLGGEGATRDRLEQLIAAQEKDGPGALWLVLIGHGTFDGRKAKFNLMGTDVTATELGTYLAPFRRPLVVVNCASSSAPFINRLSGPNRVIVTATKSGYEMNYARFGDHLSAAMDDPAADLDKDEQVSLLEAFIFAAARTVEFYEGQARLVTETALIDDNGDGRGTPAVWFRGVRAIRAARDGASLDGVRAHHIHLVPSWRERAMPPGVRERRDELERAIRALRERKDTFATEEEYYAALEPLLVEMARLYEEVERMEVGAGGDS